MAKEKTEKAFVVTREQMEKKLNVTPESFRNKARKLGLAPATGGRYGWTSQKDADAFEKKMIAGSRGMKTEGKKSAPAKKAAPKKAAKKKPAAKKATGSKKAVVASGDNA